MPGPLTKTDQAPTEVSLEAPGEPTTACPALPATTGIAVAALPDSSSELSLAPVVEAAESPAPVALEKPEGLNAASIDSPTDDLEIEEQLVPAERCPGDECPACGSFELQPLFTATDRLYRTTREKFRIVECSRCRLMRLFPQPTPSELHLYYPRNYWFVPEATAAGQLEEIYRRLVLRDHVRFVDRAIRESGEKGPVLDVGCGGGLFLSMLRGRGHEQVMGLDFSIDAARAAWEHHGVPVACATLSSAPLPEASCAAITMFHVLEHLFEPRSYLDAAHALLRDDGRLIVQTPNAACWQFIVLGGNWNGLDVPRHIYDFRDTDLELLLEACGFEVLRRKHFSLRDNPAGLATSLAPGLDPVARRVRGAAERPVATLLKDLVYFGLVAGALPFAAFESACRAGSTIMLEARKKR